MSQSIINSLKLKLVAAELRAMGITDQSKVLAVAARVQVAETGALVGLDRDGNPGVGSGPNYQIAIADIVRDMGDADTAPASRANVSSIKGNPFRQGPDYSITAQMVLMKSDPVLAEDMAAEAGVSLRRH